MNAPLPQDSVPQPFSSRWSPYAYTPRTVEKEKIEACFDAARWAPSSYNEQPWRFLIAFREQEAEFQRMLGCLNAPNQEWAKHAGVLILTAIHTRFDRNGSANRVALHDLGAAAGYFALQAAKEGLQAHQMAGVELEKIRTTYSLPEGYQPQTAIAVGYVDTQSTHSDLATRDQNPRTRKAFSEFVFSETWGKAGL
ncbi:malonic semialdehyde reductase [Roseimaritima multifibrata]|uniref:Malonic semialdehyde reductase n=1 Tax=Roseimaritima multifibrata TaxID=1930274 RepID=A0A517MBQ5_9BACT|nr:nitroreductase family protein [Roseimaritima multifibrata]QDS92291.1 malonic semialdehyde reductase [Roseimaritima multifibrata]